MSKVLCIYHKDCDDGFGAAYSIWKKLGDKVEFYEGMYQKDPPDCTNRDVIVCDFSYKRPVMEKMVAQSRSFTWLDHHKTAIEDMKDFPWRPQDICITDTNRSGAGITADWLGNRTKIIDFIEDGDLWRWKLENSLEFQAGLRSYPKDFTVWSTFENDFCIANLISEGKTILRYYNQKVDEVLKTAYLCGTGDSSFYAVNASPFIASTVANRLARMGNKLIGVSWCVNGESIDWSLRSSLKDGGLDVGIIAQYYGGGGHAQAAGFKTKPSIYCPIDLKRFLNVSTK